jgi:hypothetical protein
VVPLAVLLCNVNERRHLAARTNPEILKDSWTIARDHRKWKSRQLTLVVTGHETGREITYIGLADRGSWHGTHQEELVVTGLNRLERAVKVTEITAALPGYARKYLTREGDIPRKAGEVILSVLFALRPRLTEVVERLLQPEPPIEVRGAAGRLARQARDAFGLAMQMTGFSRDPLNRWEQPENPEQQERSFVHGLPEGRAHEKDLRRHDTERFLDWFGVDLPQLAWRRYVKGEQQLYIADVDGEREEMALGVDLIYYQETRRLMQNPPLSRSMILGAAGQRNGARSRQGVLHNALGPASLWSSTRLWSATAMTGITAHQATATSLSNWTACGPSTRNACSPRCRVTTTGFPRPRAGSSSAAPRTSYLAPTS